MSPQALHAIRKFLTTRRDFDLVQKMQTSSTNGVSETAQLAEIYSRADGSVCKRVACIQRQLMRHTSQLLLLLERRGGWKDENYRKRN
jgi:hypothetical protein